MKRWRTDGFGRRRSVAAALALLIAAFVAGLPDTGTAASQSAVAASFSREKLERADDYIRNEIASGKIPGADLLIQQHAHPAYFEIFGVRDFSTGLRTPAP